MSARVHEPADDSLTEIYDPDRPRARMAAPAAPGPAASSSAPVASAGRRPAPSTLPAPAGPPPPKTVPAERPPPTLPRAPQARPDPLPPLPGDPVSSDPDQPDAQAVPVELRRRLERSEPIRVISMKDHEAPKPRSEEPRVPLHVQLRSMAEVAGLHDAPVGLGNLAPPRDPRQARARRLRANVVWACVAIVLACAISVAIWFIAGR